MKLNSRFLKCVFVIAIVISFITIILLLSGTLFNKGDDSLELPNTKDVARIDIGTHSITKQVDINTIMSLLSEARLVSSGAVHELPTSAENILIISPVIVIPDIAEMSPTLYLFTDGGKEQIWSNVGIYAISQEKSNLIRQIYANTITTFNCYSQ